MRIYTSFVEASNIVPMSPIIMILPIHYLYNLLQICSAVSVFYILIPRRALLYSGNFIYDSFLLSHTTDIAHESFNYPGKQGFCILQHHV